MRKIARNIIALILLLIPIHAAAYTAEELYNDLGIEYVDPHFEEDLNIITAYKCAQQYVRIFSHLSTMSFEDFDFDTAKKKLKAQLNDITSQLNNGYYLQLDKIYDLESEYRETLESLTELEKLEDTDEVQLRQLDVSSIPSYTEYIQANARNTIVNTRLELGGGTPTLTPNAYIISDYNATSMTISTSELSVITSLFNGEVIDVKDNIVTLSHYNDIFTSFRGIIPSVKKGDSVYQGMCIGYSEGTVSIRMRVADQFIDLNEYLKGVE